MATRAEIEDYQSTIDGLTTVAYAQIKALLQSLDNPNPIAFRDALLLTYPDLMAPFISAASEVAAEWYSQLRSNARITAPYRPVSASLPDDAQLAAGVRYSLTPLFAPEEFIGSGVLELLAGFSQKLISNQGRDTIDLNAFQDPVRVGVARIPQPGCCAFCAMLAARGAVYRDQNAAGTVVGRGVDASVTAGKVGGQGRGLKSRGVQQLGNRYHNFCRCVAMPVFVGDKLAIDTRKKYQAIYDAAYQEADGTSVKAVLAEIRKQQGVR